MIFHSALRDIFYPARRAIIYLGQETILVIASVPGRGEKPGEEREENTEQRTPVPRLGSLKPPGTFSALLVWCEWILSWVCVHLSGVKGPEMVVLLPCLKLSFGEHLWAPPTCKACARVLRSPGRKTGPPLAPWWSPFCFEILFASNPSLMVVWGD